MVDNIKLIKYPDGSSYIELENQVKESLFNIKEFMFRVNSYEDLWHLNQLVDACNTQGVYPVVTIPNLIDAQADRRFKVTQSSGLKLICTFLNNMRASFKIFHPHNPEVVEALIDKVEIVDNSRFISKVLFKIQGGTFEKYENLILMSSDAGGFKPLMRLCDQLQWKGETFSASKARKYEDGKSSLSQIVDRQDFDGKDILIVDDLCIYGGTFKGLAKILRTKNVGKLYLAVSHLTIQNHKWEDSIFTHYDKVFTTNSKFDSYFVPQGEGGSPPRNLEVFKMFTV